MNTKPFPHQIEAAEFADAHGGRALIAHEMGCGKSFAALLWASRHPDKRPIVIVCPASLKWMWENQCATHFNWRAEVVGGTRPHRTPLPSRPKIVIVNYDVLHAWIGMLRDLKPQVVVLDETQAIGNRSARRTRSTKELCLGIPHVLALSGTPLTNRPAELWPTLNVLRPDLFPSFWPFAHRYCAAKRTWYGWDVSGASHLNELHEKLTASVMHRKRKADVLKDLPAQQNTIVLLDLTDRKEYEKTRDEYLDWIDDRRPGQLPKEARNQAKGSLFRLKHLVAQLKLPAAFDWYDSFLAGSEEKLISFGIHRETIVEAIHKRYEKQSSLITGQVTGKNRQLAFDRFIRDKKCRLLSGNIDAAGTGLSAKGVSNTVFVELPWNPAKIDQGKARTHGIGRGEKGKACQSWFLIARGSIEERLLAIVQRKRRQSDQVLDGGKTGDPFELYDELTEMLRKERYG